MRFTWTPRLRALTLVVGVGLASGGFAQEAPEASQKGEPPPKPDPGTTSQLNCIDQKAEYIKNGKSFFYVQTFENKCEARMKCAVFAYVLNARGPSHGHTTLILGAKSQGPAAKNSYALKVKGLGGFGTADRECRAF